MSEFRRRLLMQSKSDLPSAYQRVEYIESQGEQIITLDYIVQEDDVINFDYMAFPAVGEGQITQSVNAQAIAIFVDYTSNGYYYIRFGGTTSVNIGWYSFEKKIHCELKKNSVIFDGKTYSLNFVAITGIPQNIFAGIRNNGDIYSFSKVRMYAYSIYNENETKINLIPCYRKSDGEIGLYDTINKKFYTNLGTGEFLKGADV